MKRLLLATVLAAGLGAAAYAHERFDDADTDGDGFVTQAEFEAAFAARAREMFTRLDANGDGLLSESEADEAKMRVRHDLRRHRPDPAAIVSHLDSDSSGGVSFAEIDGKPFAPDAESFQAADADGSGELDAAELGELMKARFEERRGRRHEDRDS